MITNRILYIIAAAAMICLSGCRNNIQETSMTAADTSGISSSEKMTDWSLDSLVKNIELNGKTYSMPFTLDDLGDDYSVGNAILFENNTYGYSLIYKGDIFTAIVKFDGFDYTKSKIISFTASDDADLKVGEISFGDDRFDILKKYGKPSIEEQKSENEFAYFYGSMSEDGEKANGLYLYFEDNKLIGISIKYDS